MQPFLVGATIVAALVVAVNSETAYILAPVQPRILSTGWGWRPVKTVSIALPSLSKGGWGSGGGGWGGWGKKPSGISVGVYGGIRIGPKQQGWGKPQIGWGWQPPKQQGWGWQPPKQQGWGWQPPKPQGWGWKQQGWGWDDDDDDEDDYRSSIIAQPIIYSDIPQASSEEIADDDVSSSVESEEADSAEADAPLDLRNAIYYDPVYA